MSIDIAVVVVAFVVPPVVLGAVYTLGDDDTRALFYPAAASRIDPEGAPDVAMLATIVWAAVWLPCAAATILCYRSW